MKKEITKAFLREHFRKHDTLTLYGVDGTPIIFTKQRKYVVEGGITLAGEVRVQGSKNSALPILAASLLCRGFGLPLSFFKRHIGFFFFARNKKAPDRADEEKTHNKADKSFHKILSLFLIHKKRLRSLRERSNSACKPGSVVDDHLSLLCVAA